MSNVSHKPMITTIIPTYRRPKLCRTEIGGYNSTLIIIPTRNRADLAINAIRSVLNQPDCNVDVLVSDNSTESEEIRKLSEFSKQLKDTRVQYIRPPNLLPMSEHWDWVMQQGLRLYDANHFIYLTDRMIFKPNSLKPILDIAKRHPDKVISYGHDRINDYERPIRLEQNHWTGKLFEIDSSRLLFLTTRCIVHVSFPRMLNCVVPRAVLEKIRKRFGKVFDSVSPDFCFCFRCLDTVDSIIYYDAMLLIHYAIDRSNGASISRGIISKDSADFLSNLKNKNMCDMAPIPEIRTVWNAIIHEYYFVKQETQSSKFVDVDKTSYLSVLAHGTNEIFDPTLKSEMFGLLKANGWNERKNTNAFMRNIFSLKTVLRALDKSFFPAKKFNTTSEAIAYASKFPRRNYPVCCISNSFIGHGLRRIISLKLMFLNKSKLMARSTK